MAQLALSLLGPLQATLDGVPIAGFESQKVRALLAYLALEADRPHARDALAGLLWPNQSDQDARNNLRQALANLRQALGDQRATPPYLHITRDTVQFNCASDHQIDVVTFTDLLAACAQHQHRHPETCRSCAQRLQQVVDRYHGDFLASFFLADSAAFEEWVLLKRERLHQEALQALTQLANYHERHGEYVPAQQHARQQLALDPWREESHQQLMRVLAASGQRSAALVQYATCQRVLAAELGVEPETETTALYTRIRRGEMVSAVHPLPTSNLAAHTPPTPLIGREAALAQLADRLEDRHCRLLTLVGTGGIGKTRLAIQAASDLSASFPDGVAFVALAPLRSVEFIVPAIANALGFTFHGAGDPKTQLLVHLREKGMLLVLDNVEHLLDVAPLVSELLATCPDVTMLATSRAPLRIRGEQQFPVPPLQLPNLAQLPDVGPLIQYSAVALFVERAQAMQPIFQMTSATAPTVAAICAQLDGLPLAIELAAARIKLFSPEELLARLSSRLTLLTGGARDLPARQQTIRATIDWSYNLLSSAEQRLFRRLGVFVGGCTLDAAEVVCRDGWPGSHGAEATEREHPPVSVLDGLAALIDKNLVRQAAESDGDTRFEMLETIREYALEDLADSGELELLRQRHAEYFLALAEVAAPEVVGAQGLLWMERLATEYSNLRMVLEWSIPPQGQVDLGMRLAVGLLWYWIIRNHWSEGYVWLDRAALLSRQVIIAPAVQANVLRAAGIMAQFRTEYSQAIAQLEESLGLSRRTGKQTEIAEALVFLGWIARERGDYTRAEALEVEALALYQAEQHSWGCGLTLLSLGETALDRGDLAQATAYCEDLRVLCRDTGQVVLHVRAMLRLGRIAYLRAEYDYAQTLLEECRVLFQQTQAPSAVAEAQFELGRVARARGDDLAAAQQLTASLVVYRDYWGNKREIVYCLEELAGLAATTQYPVRAARLFGAAEALRASAGIPLPPVHRADYERNVTRVRAKLDEATFAAAWAAGRALTIEFAIAEALQPGEMATER